MAENNQSSTTPQLSTESEGNLAPPQNLLEADPRLLKIAQAHQGFSKNLEQRKNRKIQLIQDKGEDATQLTAEEVALIQNSNMQIKLPLQFEQRFNIFNTLRLQHPTELLSPEDYKISGAPKMKYGFVGIAWFCLHNGLEYLRKLNPEVYYKRFLFTPLSVIFYVLPFALGYKYFKIQRQVHIDLYQKYCGQMTDVELLEYELKFNPQKRVIYEFIIKQNMPSMINGVEIDAEVVQQNQIDSLLNSYSASQSKPSSL